METQWRREEGRQLVLITFSQRAKNLIKRRECFEKAWCEENERDKDKKMKKKRLNNEEKKKEKNK